MTAAVVSLVERGANAATLIAYQLLGKGPTATDLGGAAGGRGDWPFAIAGKPAVTGRVTFVEFVQAHFGHHVIENCVFDGSQADEAAIAVVGNFKADLRNVTIVRPTIGVSVSRAAALGSGATRLVNVRVVEPRGVAFQLGDGQGTELTGCDVVGVGRRGSGSPAGMGRGPPRG